MVTFFLTDEERYRARRLRAEGLSPSQVAAEIATERLIVEEMFRVISEATARGSSAPLDFDRQQQTATKQLEEMQRRFADIERSHERALLALEEARSERDRTKAELDLQSTELESTRSQLGKLQAKVKVDLLQGKGRQTALKVAYLLAKAHGYSPDNNSGAVSAVLNALHQDCVSAEDDEAFRNLFAQAFEQKRGGYWDVAPAPSPV